MITRLLSRGSLLRAGVQALAFSFSGDDLFAFVRIVVLVVIEVVVVLVVGLGLDIVVGRVERIGGANLIGVRAVHHSS
jgi:hypothetical protein